MRYATVLVALLLSASLAAQTVYRWVDDDGEVHYGHSVPPEYADRAYDRLDHRGMIQERIDRALTPEERAELAARQALEAEAQAAERNQRTRDQLLLAAYSSEEALLETLDMQLITLNSQRSSLRALMNQVTARFEDFVGRAADLERQGRPVPEHLNESIAETRSELRSLRSQLARLDERHNATVDRFEEDLARYRHLVSGGQIHSGEGR